MLYSLSVTKVEVEASWGSEYWKLAKVLLMDCAFFVTVLSILLIVHIFTRLLASAGYDLNRIEVLGTIHYYTYVIIQAIIGVDLIAKLSAMLLGGKRCR